MTDKNTHLNYKVAKLRRQNGSSASLIIADAEVLCLPRQSANDILVLIVVFLVLVV